MRDLKFRVWDIKRKAFCRQDFAEFGCIFYLKNGLLDLQNGEAYYIFQQLTGLEDRNGKEIYEGDIIQVLGAGKYPVVWDRYFFDLDNYDQYTMDNQFSAFFDLEPQEMTVIGNTFENPDLLK